MHIKDITTGLQHIGLPTECFDETVSFYEGLGFTVQWMRTGDKPVAFMALGSCVLEIYGSDTTAKIEGAWAHVSLNVTDIEAAFAWVKENGYELNNDCITDLPFFSNGVRFFMIVGPNRELVEFNQML